MATGDYTDLATIKQRLLQASTYTATTLSFSAATKTIGDTAKGLKRFATATYINVTGTASNNGVKMVVSANASGIVVSETLVDEVAGASMTLTDVSDPIDDATIAAVITAASRLIDRYCRRRFYTTATDETRYFTPLDWNVCQTEDLLSVTTLATDLSFDRTYATTWATGDYELWPWSAALDGKPYTEIRRTPLGGNYFPNILNLKDRCVKVVGKFGYASTTPAPVSEACILQTMRLTKRKDAIFGVMGSADMGQLLVLPKLDPDLTLLLDPYIKQPYGGL